MAGKYALYLPYKVFASLESGNVTDSQFREFITGLVEYDRTGTLPVFEDRAFTMLFESFRPEIDYHREKYEALIEKRRKAGADGGSSTSEKKQTAARENGQLGGAPQNNRNAIKKKDTSDFAPETEQGEAKQPKQPKHLLRLNEKTTQAESESVVSNQYSEFSSSSGEVVSQPPQTTTTIQKFLEASKKAGFILDGKAADTILATTDISPDWLDGSFTFPEYAADQIKTDPKYRDKPQRELKRLYISSLTWPDFREGFPEWRDRQQRDTERTAAAEKDRHRIDTARKNKPKTCRNCGASLPLEGEWGNCFSCGWDYLFDTEKGEWQFNKPYDFLQLRTLFDKGSKEGNGQ